MKIELSKLESLALEGHLKARNEFMATLQRYMEDSLSKYRDALLEILEPHGVTAATLPTLDRIAYDPPQGRVVSITLPDSDKPKV